MNIVHVGGKSIFLGDCENDDKAIVMKMNLIPMINAPFQWSRVGRWSVAPQWPS